MLQAEDEIIDDAVTVLHNSRANLHIAAAKANKIQGVTPCLDTPYTAYIHML
jgi:hypothetical protein